MARLATTAEVCGDGKGRAACKTTKLPCVSRGRHGRVQTFPRLQALSCSGRASVCLAGTGGKAMPVALSPGAKLNFSLLSSGQDTARACVVTSLGRRGSQQTRSSCPLPLSLPGLPQRRDLSLTPSSPMLPWGRGEQAWQPRPEQSWSTGDTVSSGQVPGGCAGLRSG